MDNTPSYGKRPLWQYLLIYLVIGGIVYFIVYFVFLKKDGSNPYLSSVYSTPSPTNVQGTPTQQANAISYTSGGFQPQVLTTKVNTKVTWTNNTDSDATVNSTPHPGHTDHPPLNLGDLDPGKSVSLSFDKPGTYTYHNHLNPFQMGKIVVE